MPLELLVFDCDGVILESVDAKTRAFARVGERFVPEYGQAAADRLVAYHVAHGGVSRFEKFAWFYREILGREITPEESAALGEEFAAFSMDEVMNSILVPGIYSVFEAWHGRVPMYVASGAPQGELSNVLEKRGLSRFFEGIYGSPPGKTDLLRRILAETKIRPDRALMIGDSTTDQYAAEATRMRFFGRGAGFRHSSWPWAEDFLGLNAYLEAVNRDEE